MALLVYYLIPDMLCRLRQQLETKYEVAHA